MSGLFMNSVLGAGIASVLGVMGLAIAADTVFEVHYPETPGWAPEVQIAAAGGGPAAPAGPPDFGTVFADEAQLTELIARGERLIAPCAACHTFEAGGPNKQGPNLHDAFGRPVASHAGFSYSAPMQAHGGNWDYLALNEFLTSPASAVPGTAMLYSGLRNERDRMAVIAYLRSISPNSVPLPAPLPPPAEAAATEAAPDAATPAGTEAAPPAPTPTPG